MVVCRRRMRDSGFIEVDVGRAGVAVEVEEGLAVSGRR